MLFPSMVLVTEQLPRSFIVAALQALLSCSHYSKILAIPAFRLLRLIFLIWLIVIIYKPIMIRISAG